MTRLGEFAIETVERQLTAVVKAKVPTAEIPLAERSARAKLATALPALDAGPLGHAFTLWRTPKDGRLEMEPGVLVSRSFAPLGEVVPSGLPAGRAARVLLTGPYDGIPGAWDALFAWCRERGLTLTGTNWQVYQHEGDDPAKVTTSLYALLA
jgi:hypothetical protein